MVKEENKKTSWTLLNWRWNCTCFVIIICIRLFEAIEKIINVMGKVWILGGKKKNIIKKERTKFKHVYLGFQGYFSKPPAYLLFSPRIVVNITHWNWKPTVCFSQWLIHSGVKTLRPAVRFIAIQSVIHHFKKAIFNFFNLKHVFCLNKSASDGCLNTGWSNN